MGVALQKAYLFFKTHLKKQTHNELVFELPQKLFQVQRREGIRLQISDLKQLWVEFKHPSVDYKKLKGKIIDLNEKGMGFMLYEEEAMSEFNLGTQLENFRFTLKGHPISALAEIRNTRRVSSPGKQDGIRVGVLFKNLSFHDTQRIAVYVLEESGKAFSNFAFD